MGISKFKFKYLENSLIKFHENFGTAVTCHYLKLKVPTEFLITLNVYGSAWHFLNYCHLKSMAISADKFKVHCPRIVTFKTLITLRIHSYIPLLSSGGTATRYKNV